MESKFGCCSWWWWLRWRIVGRNCQSWAPNWKQRGRWDGFFWGLQIRNFEFESVGFIHYLVMKFELRVNWNVGRGIRCEIATGDWSNGWAWAWAQWLVIYLALPSSLICFIDSFCLYFIFILIIFMMMYLMIELCMILGCICSIKSWNWTSWLCFVGRMIEIRPPLYKCMHVQYKKLTILNLVDLYKQSILSYLSLVVIIF